jgi:hypothetical protein
VSKPIRRSISAHLAVRIQRDEPVHLPRQPDARDLTRRGELREHAPGAGPPVGGILLRPAGPRRREPVRHLGARDDAAGLVDQQPLDRRRADVEAGEQGHYAVAPSAS